MSSNSCKNCGHYHQHYALDQKKIFRIYCGHCTFPKVKTKRPDAPACTHFTPAPPDEDAFATREYLSKALLEYALSLGLLPQIEDAPGSK